ncbi:hypothetical protein C8R46DRAFT_1217469 [Mycena filopes]|nr:hypothetical protein C8R46DRAFT_1217469 [Mycena filopes]
MSEGGPAAQIQARLANVLKNKPPLPTTSSSASSTYQHKTSLQNAFRLGFQSAVAGAVVASIRNALRGRNAGFIAPIGLFAAVGGSFGFTESVVANQRQVDDEVNPAAGACAAGFILGMSAGSLPLAVGTCSVMACAMGMYKYTDGLAPRNPANKAERSFFKPTAVVEATKKHE